MQKRKNRIYLKKSSGNGSLPLPTSSSFQTVLTGRTSRIDETRSIRKDFTKSVRSDYGRPVDIRIPYGYHAQVKKTWEMFDTDSLFHYLVTRCIDFGANGFEWEIPAVYKPGIFKKVLDWLKKRIFGKGIPEIGKVKEEERVWNYWAATINQGVPNVLPGIDEINKWIVKHLILNGMGSLGWKWKKVEINGQTYELPMEMTIWNPLSIALKRKNEAFVSEEAYIKINTREFVRETAKISGIGDITWANLPGVEQLTLMGTKPGAPQEAFILKYNWSPGDNTSLILGRNVEVGQGLYPVPPFLSLIEPAMMRRQLYAADLSILDGIINYLLIWKIGDNTKDKDGNLVHEPRPERKDSNGNVLEKSSLEIAKDVITATTRGNAMQIFLPYYWDIQIKTPDTAALLNAEKYLQPTLEILMAFGIFLSMGKLKGVADINIKNFEEMLDSIRLRHIKRFWETLCSEIVSRNKDKLHTIPNMVFNPLNTQTEDFRRGLLQLTKIGFLSMDSMLKAYRMDKKTEISRIAEEIVSGEKALREENVPVQFKQAVTKGDVTEEITSSRAPGRPGKEEEEGNDV